MRFTPIDLFRVMFINKLIPNYTDKEIYKYSGVSYTQTNYYQNKLYGKLTLLPWFRSL